MSDSQYQCLVLDYPGAHGVEEMKFAFELAEFKVQVLWLEDLFDQRLEHDQLCLRYKVLALPSLYSSRARWLALQIERELRWNLKRFADRGGLVFAVGAATDALIDLMVFGDDLSVHRKRNPSKEESWRMFVPWSGKCEWLKGLGALELPVNSEEPSLVVSDSSRVEVSGRLQRLGLSCLRTEEEGDDLLARTFGLTDVTGRIFATFSEPQFAVQTQSQQLTSPSGPGLALFQNAKRVAQND